MWNVKANAIFANIFGDDSVGCEYNDVFREKEEELLSMSEQLDQKECIIHFWYPLIIIFLNREQK